MVPTGSSGGRGKKFIGDIVHLGNLLRKAFFVEAYGEVGVKETQLGGEEASAFSVGKTQAW